MDDKLSAALLLLSPAEGNKVSLLHVHLQGFDLTSVTFRFNDTSYHRPHGFPFPIDTQDCIQNVGVLQLISIL
jgi:hypothetical protein